MGYCPVLLYIFNAVQLSKSLIYTPRHGEKLLLNLLRLKVLVGWLLALLALHLVYCLILIDIIEEKMLWANFILAS